MTFLETERTDDFRCTCHDIHMLTILVDSMLGEAETKGVTGCPDDPMRYDPHLAT